MASFCVIFKTIECDCCHTDNVKYFSVNLIFFPFFFFWKPIFFLHPWYTANIEWKWNQMGRKAQRGDWMKRNDFAILISPGLDFLERTILRLCWMKSDLNWNCIECMSVLLRMYYLGCGLWDEEFYYSGIWVKFMKNLNIKAFSIDEL